MLERFELLWAILGGWVVSILVIVFVKLKRGKNLPNGAIIIENKSGNKIIASGYNLFLLIGMGIISFLNFFVIFICIFNYWYFLARYIAFNFPKWINWIGIFGIWIQDGWGVAVFSYNINYTPAYKSMNSNYVLATGGPYKYVRHPMYIAKALLVIFFFLATGIWLSLIGALSWIGITSQAKMEEEALTNKFGKVYEEYLDNTGRFFPKLK
ncbi:MAG: isoprenylcysteine carboxylmethyltransferase family protein [Candidatus Lokiarchaeota archaeon]|nr:isoprenylcysteine carboxylmethyltransferase family protein [Candidatus Lokiarchaeota archaeon]